MGSCANNAVVNYLQLSASEPSCLLAPPGQKKALGKPVNFSALVLEGRLTSWTGSDSPAVLICRLTRI
jgi:hypothetical protein